MTVPSSKTEGSHDASRMIARLGIRLLFRPWRVPTGRSKDKSILFRKEICGRAGIGDELMIEFQDDLRSLNANGRTYSRSLKTQSFEPPSDADVVSPVIFQRAYAREDTPQTSRHQRAGRSVSECMPSTKGLSSSS